MLEVLRHARNFHTEKEGKKGRSSHFHISFFSGLYLLAFSKKSFSVCIFGQEIVSLNQSEELNLSVRILGHSLCQHWALFPHGQLNRPVGCSIPGTPSWLIQLLQSDPAGLVLSDEKTRKIKPLHLVKLEQRNCFSQWKWIRQIHFTGLHHAVL